MRVVSRVARVSHVCIVAFMGTVQVAACMCVGATCVLSLAACRMLRVFAVVVHGPLSAMG
jgi:hypothetical protein